MRRDVLGSFRRRRFPILALLCVLATAILMGSTMSSFLTRAVTEWEWENTGALTRQAAELAGLDDLFAAPQTAEVRERWKSELARLFSSLPEIVRLKVWDRDGTILWSDEPRLIGQRFPDNREFRQALAGHVSVEVKKAQNKEEHRYEQGPFETLAEVYVPISSRRTRQTVGVLEVYKAPRQLDAAIRQGTRIVWIISLGGGLVLYLVLLPLFRLVFEQEVAHARRLEQEAYARALETEVAQRTQELERTQAQLAQAQKMEAVGRLAGGIAHDFNNLLTVITGRSELLLEGLERNDPRFPQVDLIRKTADRAATLTQQLLAFSRKQILQPRDLDLNAVVTRLEPMLRRLIGEDIELAAALAPALGCVRADPGQLEQVLMNLAVNARDAMPRGGRITITTANAELDEDYARRHPGVRPGPYVMLAVSDTGEGMDAGTRARIFEPFFTTKGPGKGTGLGLATVHGIVNQSGGHVWVYSEVGRGTAFKIYLPRLEATAAALEQSRVSPLAARGAETILLVEDEGDLRELAREILESYGYTVLSASHPDQAHLVVGRHRGPIHLLLTDVVMPRMSGRDLASRLAVVRPGLKVLYMSGYTDDAIVQHGVLEPGTAFLSKPFTSSALVRKVQEVLDGREEGRGAPSVTA